MREPWQLNLERLIGDEHGRRKEIAKAAGMKHPSQLTDLINKHGRSANRKLALDSLFAPRARILGAPQQLTAPSTHRLEKAPIMTTCPHCEIEVSTSALVCRSCNKRLDASTTPTHHQDRQQLSGRALLAPPDPTIARVSVVDINMPFGSMVGFMIRWTLAAIPAMAIVGLIVVGLTALLSVVVRLAVR